MHKFSWLLELSVWLIFTLNMSTCFCIKLFQYLKENNKLAMVDTSKNYVGLHQPVFFFSGEPLNHLIFRYIETCASVINFYTITML